MPNNISKQEALHWLGDRGVSVLPNDIRTYNDWALVIHRDYKDIDCYKVDWDNLYAEPWDNLDYNNSSFKPKNEERTKEAVEKMEREYKKYLEEIKNGTDNNK